MRFTFFFFFCIKENKKKVKKEKQTDLIININTNQHIINLKIKKKSLFFGRQTLLKKAYGISKKLQQKLK